MAAPYRPLGADMHTFEIRICVKNRWTTEERCSDRNEALKKGAVLARDNSLGGVKVIEEIYDEKKGLFKENVIFSQFGDGSGDKAQKAARDAVTAARLKKAAMPVRAAQLAKKSNLRRNLMLIGFLLLSLTANVVLGLVAGGDFGNLFQIASWNTESEPGKAAPDGSKQKTPVIYELPSVTMTFGRGGNTRTLKVKLGLELANRRDIKKIEAQLTKIITSVANDLRAVDNGMLHQREGLKSLRKALHEGVQSAAGSTPVEGVLFKEIIVF